MTRRDYKLHGEGEYFHVYNRRNNFQDIFLDDDDCEFFLLKLRQNIFPDLALKIPNCRVRPRRCIKQTGKAGEIFWDQRLN